ncbi:hypothetical protein BBJ28_00013198 [Nothophytophthora sp. Chile5]|nr:hypothetical protein BBJ28_00013198 [Nothophytophthora sp. Chile5]
MARQLQAPAKKRRAGTRPRVSGEGVGVWTAEEHARFLEAIRMYPHGPWKLVADHIATRSTRQSMTHAQKYRQKLERRRRGLRTARRPRNPSDSRPSRPLEPTRTSPKSEEGLEVAAEDVTDTAMSDASSPEEAMTPAQDWMSFSFEELLCQGQDADRKTQHGEESNAARLEAETTSPTAVGAPDASWGGSRGVWDGPPDGADLSWLDGCLDFIIDRFV